MNKKILTRVISFVLVICLLVPVLPGLGIDLSGLVASAAMPTPSSSAILFKTGSRYYWISGTTDTQIPLVGTEQPKPLYSSGSYYLPVGIVNTLTSASLAATDTFNGVGYIKVTHGGTVTGNWKTYISNMGFIQLTTGSDTISSASDSEQTSWIKSNVFDITSVTTNTNNPVTSVFTTNSLTGAAASGDHPYLVADQTEFDYLNSVYTGAVVDPTLKSYLDYLVSLAQSTYDKYATGNEGALKSNYAAGGANDLSVMTNGTYGYDGGGRQQDAPNRAAEIERVAYAYQITRDTKFSNLALNLSLALCSWTHWGSRHFLNSADTSYHMALVYDWCYDAWDATSRNTVRDGLFVKGVMAGIWDTFSASISYKKNGYSNTTWTISNPWHNPSLSGNALYIDRTNNWNGVCTSGMIMASLALLSETGDYTGLTFTTINSSGTATTGVDVGDYGMISSGYNGYGSSKKGYVYNVVGSTYQSASAWLINNNIYYLCQNGFGQYIPDGSYIESASYWSYGTNSIFRAIACLDQTCGNDFGLSAAGGLDKTMYFSYYAQSSDGISWRYHDDTSTSIDTGMNALHGSITGDEAAVAYRKYLIEKGAASATVFDTFNYDSSVTSFDRMPLDYYMESIEGYSMRDTWEKDGIYVAFQGGTNYANHVQIDSGAFVYHSNGTAWFQDIGAEDYNALGFSYGTKTIQGHTTYSSGDLMYYPNTAEGNNTLVANDASKTPFGQKWGYGVTAGGTMEKYGTNDHGSYAVLNQTSVYNASSAKRGILMTNDRKTVVVQDEVTYSSATESYWVGHLGTGVSVELSADKKTAYLTDGKSTIRVTAVSDAGYTFSVKGANDHLLNNTASPTYSADNFGSDQKDFSNIQKLVISIPSTTSVKLAVVIEEVTIFSSDKVGYSWIDMSSWSESTPAKDSGEYDDKVLLSKDFDVDGIGTFVSNTGNLRFANTYIDGDNAMGAYFNEGNENTSKMTLTSAPVKANFGYIGNGMIVTEFDLLTLDSIPAGVKFELYGTDIYPIVSVDASVLGKPTDWAHVTMVLDEDTDIFYVFVGDDCVISQAFESKSYKDLKLVISTPAGAINAGNMFIDNVVIRTYTDAYTALDGALASGAAGNNDVVISDWVDASVAETTETYTGDVARLWYEAIDAPPADDDTPIIDFWSDAVIVSTNDTQAEASVTYDVGEVYASSFEDLMNKINSGSYNNVELYVGNRRDPINITISSRVTVDTNGHDFYATADNLVCIVEGEIHTYKKGTIQVKFVINGATTRVTYSNTKLATYKVSAGAVDRIVERDNGDGTYTYIVTKADSWSLTAYGDAAIGYELLTTSENNTFYLTGNPYSGNFVTVKNGVITPGGNNPAAFFNVLGDTNEYDKISVTNDFYYDGSDVGGGETVRGSKNVYLNGHTITYYTPISSDHMFSVHPGNQINVYGPGTIDNNAIAANVIYKADGHTSVEQLKTCTFNNLTINSTYQITDVREGRVEFNNCDATAEAYIYLFGVSNYSGKGTDRGTNYTTDENYLGTLVLNGGTMTHNYASGARGIVTVSNNARLILEGGVNLIAAKAYGAVILEHSSVSRDESIDKTGMDLMSVHIGDIHYNSQALYYYNKSDERAPITPADHIKWIEGAGFTSPEAREATGYEILDGHVLAKTGSAGYAYRVVADAHAATVTWDGANQEYWVEGSTPNRTNGGSADDGKKATYDRSVLNGKGVAGGQSYNFKTVQIDDLELRMNLSLYNDFVVNIYVERNADIPYEYVKINGKTVDAGGAKTINGKRFYVYVISDIAPQNAAELITVSVKLNNGKEITAVTSILNYAEKLLQSTKQSSEMKSLMYSIVEYVGAGSAYVGNLYNKASCDALLANYSAYDPNSTVTAKTPDLKNVKSAVKSVYLDLAGSPTYAFRFNSGFSGPVTFTYTSANVDSETGSNIIVTNTVTVAGGKVVGTDSDVFQLSMKAYDMATDLTITVDDASSVYNIEIYYSQAVQDKGALYDLVCALKGYCDAANAYKATQQDA